MLDYFPNADHAPIYAAQANGNFKQRRARPEDPPARRPVGAAEAGGRGPGRPGDLLRARGAARARQGAERRGRRRARADAADLDHLAAKAKITKPADLEGKTVGTAGIDYQNAYLQTILDDAKVPQSSVKERNVGFNLVPALLTGKVDAILGGFWNYEAIDLAQRRSTRR